MAFGITDTIVAGRYADTALAALSVGSAIYISVFVALMGVLQALRSHAGKTIIMVTHDPKAAAFGTRQIHLEKGELLNDIPVAAH